MKLILGGLLLATSLAAHAQTIEVASIHPHKLTGDDPSNRNVLPGGRFVATATSVQTLIRSAFAMDYRAILNAPAWTESELFDITATTNEHQDITKPEQYSHLLLSLLETQFGFHYHREQREGAVFFLVLDRPNKPGPLLKPSAPGTQLNLSMNGDRRIQLRATNLTMYDFAKSLQKRAGRTIEDRTGLTGGYDFQIQWAPDPSPESDDPSLPTVLKEQLGLKLQPAKDRVDVIIIDAINHPTTD
jgi:uncharacterized protein (TIGR03435 family)